MTQKYAVGDKVRILGLSIFDADEIGKTVVVTDGNRELCIGGFGAVVKLSNGVKRVYKYENIEKVAEQMTKFNVGDTVRAITEEYGMTTKSAGWEGVVTEVEGGIFRGKTTKGKYSAVGFVYNGLHVEDFELVNAKSTQDKPKKKARISALEQQVAELTAKVEALEKAQKPTREIGVDFAYEPKLSANEQRKAIIAEAKSFVAKYEAVRAGEPNKTLEGTQTARNHFYEAEFAVKDSKVTAVIYRLNSGRTRQGKPSEIGRSKCAPDDVFNADIGKAIALGRALGLDVKRFEQAVKPTEVVVGTVVTKFKNANIGLRQTVTEIITDRNTAHFGGGKAFNTKEYGGWLAEGQVAITDDTGAQY